MFAYKIKIYGNVQKVGFRKFIFANSLDFGVKGYVENQKDGTVLIHAEGEEKDLEGFIEICRKGPERALVEKVEIEEAEIQDSERFEVRRD